MNNLEESILEFVKQRGGGVTFAELSALPGFAGEKEMVNEEYNHVLWSGISDEFIDALKALRTKLSIRPTSYLTYLADGKLLSLPLVKRPVKYKKPRWLPVTFSLKEAHE